jgi:hypothetical protein
VQHPYNQTAAAAAQQTNSVLPTHLGLVAVSWVLCKLCLPGGGKLHTLAGQLTLNLTLSIPTVSGRGTAQHSTGSASHSKHAPGKNTPRERGGAREGGGTHLLDNMALNLTLGIPAGRKHCCVSKGSARKCVCGGGGHSTARHMVRWVSATPHEQAQQHMHTAASSAAYCTHMCWMAFDGTYRT